MHVYLNFKLILNHYFPIEKHEQKLFVLIEIVVWNFILVFLKIRRKVLSGIVLQTTQLYLHEIETCKRCRKQFFPLFFSFFYCSILCMKIIICVLVSVVFFYRREWQKAKLMKKIPKLEKRRHKIPRMEEATRHKVLTTKK